LLFVCLILWCFFSKLPTRQAICHILQSASSFLGLLLPIKGYVGEGGGEANALYRASPIGRPVSPLSIVLYPYIVHGSTNWRRKILEKKCTERVQTFFLTKQ
jgi:hypothetical protein